MSIKINLLVLFLLMLRINAYAETLSVNDAIKYAFDNSPQLQIYQKEIEALELEKGYSISLQKPQLIYFEEGIDNYSSGNFSEQRFSLYQNFEFPLNTIYRKSAFNHQIEGMKMQFNGLKLELISKVKQAYATILRHSEEVKLRSRQMDIADTLRKAVEIRYKSGYVSEIEYLKADIFYNETKNLKQDANIKFHTSRYELFNLIGLDIELQKYDIVYSDSLIFVEFDIKQKVVLQKLEDYPKYKAETHMIESKNKFKKEIQSNLFPDFNLGYYSIDYGSGFKWQGFEIGIDLPIWFAFDDSKRIQEKQIEVEIEEITANQILLNLKKDVEMAWHGFDESRKKIINFNSSIRDKSKRLNDLALVAYHEGEMDLLTLLIYENTYIENELNYIYELENYYRNVIELEKFMQEEYLFN